MCLDHRSILTCHNHIDILWLAVWNILHPDRSYTTSYSGIVDRLMCRGCLAVWMDYMFHFFSYYIILTLTYIGYFGDWIALLNGLWWACTITLCRFPHLLIWKERKLLISHYWDMRTKLWKSAFLMMMLFWWKEPKPQVRWVLTWSYFVKLQTHSILFLLGFLFSIYVLTRSQ